jgi:hypothetical protein
MYCIHLRILGAKSIQSLIKLCNTTFIKFIVLLKQSQGATLRVFSHSLSKVVDSLFYHTSQESETFMIEKANPGTILKYPKGSDAFLHLIG